MSSNWGCESRERCEKYTALCGEKKNLTENQIDIRFIELFARNFSLSGQLYSPDQNPA